MPIKVTYATLHNPAFIGVIGKINRHSFKKAGGIKVAYNIKRILDRCEQENKTLQDLWIKLLKDWALLDDKGEFVPLEGRPGTFQVPPEKAAEFDKAVEEFHKLEFEINRYPIKLDDMDEVGLSASDLSDIECLLDPEDAAA